MLELVEQSWKAVGDLIDAVGEHEGGRVGEQPSSWPDPSGSDEEGSVGTGNPPLLWYGREWCEALETFPPIPAPEKVLGIGSFSSRE